MKKISKILMLLLGLALFDVTSSKAQASFSVGVRLNRPARYERYEAHRPVQPSSRHVWVSEEWRVHGRRHVYQPGYWSVPPSEGEVWEPGRWDPSPQYPGKYVWVAGHWRPR